MVFLLRAILAEFKLVRTDGVYTVASNQTRLSAALIVVMGTVPSLLRRDAAVEPIPRREKVKEGYTVMPLEEEGLGPAALEARGDWFLSTGRHRRGWSCAVSRIFKEAAYAYVLAENCRLHPSLVSFLSDCNYTNRS